MLECFLHVPTCKLCANNCLITLPNYQCSHAVGRILQEKDESSHTWTVGHCVKVAVGQHEMLRPTLWLQPDSDVGDAVIEAGEASKKVNGESAGGTLHVHRELMGARCCLDPNVLYLLQ